MCAEQGGIFEPHTQRRYHDCAVVWPDKIRYLSTPLYAERLDSGDICAPSNYLQTEVINSVLTASCSGKIRRHMQPYVSLALWGLGI